MRRAAAEREMPYASALAYAQREEECANRSAWMIKEGIIPSKILDYFLFFLITNLIFI
jgi:hypothetical protein